MRRTQLCGILAATVLTLSVAFGRAPAAEKVAGDRLLPPDVYLYVEIPSVPEFKARWGKTLTGQLSAEPALADFWKEVESQFDKFSEQAQEEVGVSLKGMLAVPSGQITVAVLRAASGEVGMVAILDYGENGSTVDKLLATAAEKLQEQGAERKDEDIDGTKLVVHTITEKKEDGEVKNDDGEKPETNTVVWSTRDNHLVVSSGVEISKAVLARWDGKHSSTFADSETHRYIRTRCRTSNSEPAFNWYVNPVGLVQGVIESMPNPRIEAQLALNFLPQLGLTELKAIGGSVDMNAGEFDTVSRTVVYVEGTTRGLLNVLHFPETELSPPKWVSASASSYVTYNWDVLGAYSAIEGLIDGFRGPGTLANLIDQMAQQPDGPQIHLKKDFLEHLTGRVHMVGAPPKELPAEGAPPEARALFAFDTTNADKMKATLASVAKTPEFKGKTREFGGTTVYEFEAGQGPVAASATAAAVVDNALMVSTDVAMLEQVIRADSSEQPLSESADYRRIAAHFPPKASAIEFEKQDAQVEMVYEMLRGGKLPLPIPAIDFSKLPPFSEIKKYLPPTGCFAVPDAHGAYYETFSLPKSEN